MDSGAPSLDPQFFAPGAAGDGINDDERVRSVVRRYFLQLQTGHNTLVVAAVENSPASHGVGDGIFEIRGPAPRDTVIQLDKPSFGIKSNIWEQRFLSTGGKRKREEGALLKVF